jgi:hypothetical protein
VSGTQRPVPRPKRADIDPSELDLFDEALTRISGWRDVGPSDDFQPIPYFGVLLNSPPIAARQTAMGSTVRSVGNRPGSYSHADREWVDQVLSYEFDYYGVLEIHTPDAIAVGVRLQAIEALRDGREQDLTDDERFLTAYIRQVISGSVTDQSWQRMVDRLGQRGAIEYTYFIAYLQLVIRLHMAFGAPSPSREEIDEILQGFRDGTRDVRPDWKSRLG